MITIYLKQYNKIIRNADVELFEELGYDDILWIDMITPSIKEQKAVENFMEISLQTKQQVEEIESTSKYSETENLGDAQYVSATTAQQSKETLSDYKLKRDAAHDKATEMFNSVIKDQKSSDKAVDEASESLNKLSDTIKDEADLENLINAKTSADTVVIIDGDICQVIVPKGVLNDNVSLQIKELVMNQTKISSKNITIIELKD